MIYTCTTNPSLDYYMTINDYTKRDCRSELEMFDAGGKGVNVSIVLNNLRIPSCAIGFLGGFTKDYYLSFISKYPYIQPLFTSIEENTRINIKIMGDDIVNLNAKGPHISKSEFERFKNRTASIYSDDIFVLSGNIQEEIEDDVVNLVHELSKDGVKMIINTDYKLIERCLDVCPYMIKLNRKHIGDNDPVSFSKQIIGRGAKRVMYSASKEDSYLFSETGVYRCSNLDDSLVNITGSSDSMVAGFLYGVIRGADNEECFKYACSASLATCLSNDLGSKEKIEDLFNKIEVVAL